MICVISQICPSPSVPTGISVANDTAVGPSKVRLFGKAAAAQVIGCLAPVSASPSVTVALRFAVVAVWVMVVEKNKGIRGGGAGGGGVQMCAAGRTRR